MSNPLFGNNFIERTATLDGAPMTINGTVNKILLLFALLFVSASYIWYLVHEGYSDKASVLTVGGIIAGLLFSVIILFSRKLLSLFSPLYAVAEGFGIGGFSAVYAASYASIVMQAVAASFISFFAVIVLYKAGFIRCTDRFRAVLFTCITSVMLIYLIQIVAGFFGRGIPAVFDAGPVGICFSLFVVVIAAMSFISDFDFIDRGVRSMLDKNYEWYAAFGIMVTFIWLYVEILNLLAKLRR